MIDHQIKLSTLLAALFALLAAGLVVGAWWLPYLGWLAVLCGQVVLYMLSTNEHARTRHVIRVTLAANHEPPNGGARPIR